MPINLTVTNSEATRRWIAAITPRMETTRDNIKRACIQASLPPESEIPAGEMSAAFFYHPACAACSSGTIAIQELTPGGPDEAEIQVESDRVIDVSEITLEEFLDLPGAIFQEWAESVLLMNAHLLNREKPDEKKR